MRGAVTASRKETLDMKHLLRSWLVTGSRGRVSSRGQEIFPLWKDAFVDRGNGLAMCMGNDRSLGFLNPAPFPSQEDANQQQRVRRGT